MKFIKSAILSEDGKRLYLTTADGEFDNAMARRKLGTENCPWDEGLNDKFLEPGEWVNLKNGFARCGISAAVFVVNKDKETMVILNRFDSGHPTKANQITPPSGVWDSMDLDLFDSALEEIGEEVIVKFGNQIATWSYRGLPLCKDWVQDYADDHNFTFLDRRIKLNMLSPGSNNVVLVYLNGNLQGPALLSLEPETASIETTFLFTINDEIDELLDGEKLPNGEWRNSQSAMFTLEGLTAETAKTPKAEAVQYFMEKFSL